MSYIDNIKPGMYVYCPIRNANVMVFKAYYCENTAMVNKVYADRISTVGVDAPKYDFSRPRPEVETILYARSDRGGYYESGIMGKQGEPWAISGEDK
jgi:hypothetical protein